MVNSRRLNAFFDLYILIANLSIMVENVWRSIDPNTFERAALEETTYVPDFGWVRYPYLLSKFDIESWLLGTRAMVMLQDTTSQPLTPIFDFDFAFKTIRGSTDNVCPISSVFTISFLRI